MIKICFFQNQISHEKVLNTFSKMTPNSTGIWKDLVGVTNPDIADFHVIIDETNLKVDSKKAIYVGGHPTSCTGYNNFENRGGYVAKLDLAETFGFGEWWLKANYNELSSLQSPNKTKDLTCILSNTRVFDYHRKRVKFMMDFCSKYPIRVDLYGRIIIREGENSLHNSYKGPVGVSETHTNYEKLYWFGKRKALEPYRYSLEFDMGRSPEMGICENYWSERFFDSMLLWTMPIYYGGTNIHKYLPENSFRYIDLFNPNHTPEYVIDIIDSDFREKHIEDMKEARNLLLNKYQIWPRIFSVIKGL